MSLHFFNSAAIVKLKLDYYRIYFFTVEFKLEKNIHKYAITFKTTQRYKHSFLDKLFSWPVILLISSKNSCYSRDKFKLGYKDNNRDK